MLRDVAAAWICKASPIRALQQEFLQRLDAANEQGHDCFFLLGPKTNKRNKAYLVHCYAGELFVFPLTPDQATAAGCVGSEMTSGFGDQTTTVAPGLPFALKVEQMEIDGQSSLKVSDQIRGRCHYELTGQILEPWCLCLAHAQLDRGARVYKWFTPIVAGLYGKGSLEFTFAPIKRSGEDEALVWRGTTAVFLRFFSMPNRSTVEDRVPLSNAAATLIEVI